MCLAVLLALMIAVPPALALQPGAIHLAAGSFDGEALSRLAPPETDDGLWILHFAGPIGRSDRETIHLAGGRILGYVPDKALLVRGSDPERMASISEVDFASPYRPEWRRDPGLDVRGGEVLDLCLELLPGESAGRFGDRAVSMGAQLVRVVEREDDPRVYLRISANQVERLSALSGLRWMGEVGERSERLQFVRWIVQSAVLDSMPIWDAGLHGEGQIVGHIDSGFELENCFFHDPDGNPVGPDHRKVVYMDPQMVYSSHGLHTASIVAGDIEPLYGWDTNRGLAYHARLATSRYNVSGFDLYEALSLHHDYGARVHTNSWGDDSQTRYTQDCRDIDRYSHDFEEDMVAFAETNQYNLRTPENAKSVLAVGATRNGVDLFEMHGYGGIGPTYDGRRKPEIYTPGRTVWAAATAYTDDPEDWENYCRGTGKGGTSMACPTAAAAGAIIRQYFTEGWYPGGAPSEDDAFTPTGALLRAALLNATHDLMGVDGYPSDLEGWGRLQLDLGLMIEADSPLSLYLEDFRHAEGLDTGQQRIFHFTVSDDSLDLKVTMAFSDYPAEVFAEEAVVNDLDLVLASPSGETYRGNWFDGGFSVPGGERDSLNCVERVIVPSPAHGAWTVFVNGANVPMGPQGFAFIVSGQLTDSDAIPPALALDLEVEEDVLHLLLSSSEPLDAESIAMSLNSGELGVDLHVDPVPGGEGLLWESSYRHESGATDFSLQTCGSDLAGNQTCLFEHIGLFPMEDAQSAFIQSDDGRFALDFPPGSYEGAPLIAIHPVDRPPYLGVYEMLPPQELAAPAILEWDYRSSEFPSWGKPENLKIRDEEGRVLESYFDTERQKIIASFNRLGEISIGWGFDGSSDELDSTFGALGEAHPNPYCPSVHGDIRFSLELRDTQRLKAEIYDVGGRRVGVLQNGWVLPGRHDLIWNGLDVEGHDAAGGVYFLRLEAAGKVMMRKLVLMR